MRVCSWESSEVFAAINHNKLSMKAGNGERSIWRGCMKLTDNQTNGNSDDKWDGAHLSLCTLTGTPFEVMKIEVRKALNSWAELSASQDEAKRN